MVERIERDDRPDITAQDADYEWRYWLWMKATYPFRRAIWALLIPDPECRVYLCARRVVGFSVYCRHHTDQIMEPSNG